MHSHKKSMTPGIILIVAGLFFLFKDTFGSITIWEHLYPILMLLISGLLLWEAGRRKNDRAVFWGVVLLILGGFFLLRNFDVIPYFYAEDFWPVFLLAPGIAFILKYASNPKEWGVLIPGTILIFFGLKNMVAIFFDCGWDTNFCFDNLWPLILIVIGGGIILSGYLESRRSKTDV